MLPTGFAYFTYGKGEDKQKLSFNHIEVNCGCSRLEKALGESLYNIGLRLPYGNLIINRDKEEIYITRSYSLEEEGPIIFYRRKYPTQDSFNEILGTINKTIERFQKGHEEQLDKYVLSELFEEYLTDNMYFNEKSVFMPSTHSKAEIRNKVTYLYVPKRKSPIEQQEYSILLNRLFVEDLDRFNRINYRKRLSPKNKALSSKMESIKLKEFLKMADFLPSRSKYENIGIFKDLQRCMSYIIDVTFNGTRYFYKPFE